MAVKTPYQLVREFHEKFGLAYNDGPRLLGTDEQKFRLTCLHEELDEYEEAVFNGDQHEQLDALVDLVYFACGTAHRNGWNFDEAFRRVHAANMTKVLDPAKQRRGWKQEINKPDGWQGPVLDDLIDSGTATRLQPGALAGRYKGLILIDGPDGSGKTTLSERICELTGGEYIHLYWSEAIEEHMHTYRTGALYYAAAMAKDTVVVLERAWLSHPIYSLVYRGGEMHPWQNWKAFTDSEQNVSILSVPTNEDLWLETYVAGVQARTELYGHVEHEKMQDVYHMFNSCLPQQGEVFHFKPQELSSVDNEAFIRYDMHRNNTPASLDSWICSNVITTLEAKDGK